MTVIETDKATNKRIDAGVTSAIERPVDSPPAVKKTWGSIDRACLLILVFLALFYTAYFARAILLPTILALLLSLVLQPLVSRLNRLGIPNVMSVVIVFLVLTAVGVGSIRLVWGPAQEWLAETPRSLQEIGQNIRSYAKPLEKLQQAKESVDDITSMPGEKTAVPVRIEQPRLANQMANTTGEIATGVSITIILLFFLLATGDRFLEKTLDMASHWGGKRDLVHIFREVQRQLSTYLGAITLINILLGVIIGVGLWLIGMPNPLLWGVLAALLNYIPFAGLATGTFLVFVAAMGQFHSLGHALLAPAIYLAANGVEANFITPAVLGRSVRLDPVIILVAIFVGGWIWGIGGIFLAVPVLLVARITSEHFEHLKPIAMILAK